VQVKTSTSTIRNSSFSGRFKVPLAQLKNISNIPIHYVFIVRNNDLWTKPVIIRQDYLLDHFQNGNIGSEYEGNLNLYFSFLTRKVECSGLDLSIYLSDFIDFPSIEE
jgi:hypothetical protein